MNAYAVNNNFNASKANIAKMILLGFLGVQAIRQLIDVNTNAGGDKPTESQEGKVAAWFTIVMTLIAAVALYLPKTPHLMALWSLVLAALGSGVAMIYNVMSNHVKPEKYRLWFGIAHVILAMLVLAYLIVRAVM
jgi:hypothetical protein